MAIFKSFFMMLFFLFLSFTFDSQVVLVLNIFLPNNLVLSSHMSLIALLYFEKRFSNFGIYLIYLLFGLLIDGYYYHTFGLAVFLYPLLVYLVKKHSGLILMTSTRFLMLLALILIFEGGSYCLASIYGLTNYPINLEITNHLMQTLVFNSVLFLLTISIFNVVTE
ncbi:MULTISPECIES: rod shape-determining protein MreD [Streptococcus]|uniref:Rod shape-determining protein MreD n=1 Tax=Streptococcus caledonicus TaxID=2614158 RepID=A0ABW0UF52_9STRE|nr:rod shape-determining protein MreD [Streptococcus sp. S784/96/1]